MNHNNPYGIFNVIEIGALDYMPINLGGFNREDPPKHSTYVVKIQRSFES